MTVHIRVEHASLLVPMYLQPDRQAKGWMSVLAGAVLDPPRRRYVKLLDDLNFEVKAGERMAILGQNGAGKSTLLRLLNGVYVPTSGSVTVSGTRSAMLNISLGFNSNATVRENIFLRGAAMDIPINYLRGQIMPILEFADLVEKANHRLHTLSTGQRMRLGFAISTSVKHDVILMDEWIGSGDDNFTRKARDRMSQQVAKDSIMILASHSVGLLRGLCTSGIVIDKGRLLYRGDIESALKFYNTHLAGLRKQTAAGVAGITVESGQSIYGCVENISLEASVLRLKGWLASTDGPRPEHLAVSIGGKRVHARRVERYNRPDVVKHLGLIEDGCGFNASFHVPRLDSVERLRGALEVFGGVEADHINTSVRLGPAVLAAIGKD